MNKILYFWITVLLVFGSFGINAQSGSYFTSSTPEAEGVSSSAILSFIERAESEIDAVHSYMILRHGKLISQGWWDPYGPDIPHEMHSLSKSFTSTAIGFAVDEGLLSLNDLVISFFPDETPAEPGWQLKELRIRDLITMNTGHVKEPRPGQDTENWVKIFLESEIEFLPGTHFQYNSMATYMLSAILQKVSGEKVVDYLEPRLFEPLQIKKPDWDTCPMGINTGGWGLHIVTEDIAKLGQLYLQDGMWKGKQILSEEWVKMATSKQVSNGSNPENDWAQGYGFQFWRCRHNCFRGDGAFGQFCIVMPDQDAVVAITSGESDMGAIMQIIWDILLPAMKDNPLPANNSEFEKLVLKTEGLKIKPVTGETSSPISKKISKKTFTIPDNETGVKAISLKVHGKDPMIIMEAENGTETLQIGSGKFARGKLNDRIPYTDNLYGSIAASGAWVDHDKYQVRIAFIETTANITYSFRFNEDGLKWESNLKNSLFGPRTTEPLSGR